MPERVAHPAVAAIEFIAAGAHHSRSCSDGAVEPGIGIIDIEHQRDGGASGHRVGRNGADLLLMLGKFVGQIDGAAIDPQRRVADLVLILVALQLFGGEGGLVEGDRVDAAPDAQIGRNGCSGLAHTVSSPCNSVGWL